MLQKCVWNPQIKFLGRTELGETGNVRFCTLWLVLRGEIDHFFDEILTFGNPKFQPPKMCHFSPFLRNLFFGRIHASKWQNIHIFRLGEKFSPDPESTQKKFHQNRTCLSDLPRSTPGWGKWAPPWFKCSI